MFKSDNYQPGDDDPETALTFAGFQEKAFDRGWEATMPANRRALTAAVCLKETAGTASRVAVDAIARFGEPDMERLRRNLGAMMFYAAVICTYYGLSLEDVCRDCGIGDGVGE